MIILKDNLLKELWILVVVVVMMMTMTMEMTFEAVNLLSTCSMPGTVLHILNTLSQSLKPTLQDSTIVSVLQMRKLKI